MTTEPYFRKQPGDIIQASEWNDLQSMARDEIRSHTHGGGEDGRRIPRSGIEPKAINGSLIDPRADVTLNSLTVEELIVSGQAVLAQLKKMAAQLENTLNLARGGAIEGSLEVSGSAHVHSLTCDGPIVSRSGGILFPDGSVQVSAVSIQAGTETFGQQSGVQTLTRQVNLQGFASPPRVVVSLSLIDANLTTSLRIKTHVTAVTSEQFTINVDSWADTTIYSSIVSWIAFGASTLPHATGENTGPGVRPPAPPGGLQIK
jgi:hypothetical protein